MADLHRIYCEVMLKTKKIAFIGAGNISEALVSGLVKKRVVHPSQIHATDVSQDRLTVLKERYDISIGLTNIEAVKWSDIVVFCVKPQVISEVLSGLDAVSTLPRLWISVAAGIPISQIIQGLQEEAHVIRVMPNTASSVLEGAAALAGGPGVSSQELLLGQTIFESVGKAVVVEESLMDAVTGLSGGGPAYVYVFIEALADGGVKMGLTRPVAQLLAAQTVLGAAKMVLEKGESPGDLKNQVASPGGTTIVGLHALEQGRLRATVMNAVEGATLRSKELGNAGKGGMK